MIREAMDSISDMHQEDDHDEEEAGQESKESNDITLQHAVLGSGLPPLSFSQLAEDNSADTAFRDLRKKVSKKLSAVFSEESGEYQRVTLTDDHEVRIIPHMLKTE